jgi:p90 ribosomal S6 kinase
MLTRDFEIKLIDLGYGLALDGRNETGFMKSRCGTYMYMAPEILDRTAYYQGQDSDCFAFGVCLLVSKLGDYPWARPDVNIDEHYKALANSHGVNADKFWALYKDCMISDDFKNLIESMLAFDPSSRPTMADVLGHSWLRG